MPKTYLHHPDGSVTIEDDRQPELTRSEQLNRLREACTASILHAAPEHTQRNAALGIVPMQPVVDAINVRRDHYHALAAQLAAIVWDGQDITRTDVCDEMEAVQWSEP